MIPIKINGKKYKIPSIKELNTREFIEVTKIENIDYVKYIAWATKKPMKEAFFAVTSMTVEKAIGRIPDITKLKKSARFDYSKLIETLGQRHQIERSKKEGFELLVYVLAVAMARDDDEEKVIKLYDEYMEQSFTEILPSGFFFFKILQNGKKPGQGFLARIMGLTRIFRTRKVRALTS